MENKTAIIDCDPGIDDAFALTYLHGCKEYDVKVCGSVAGNVSIGHTTRNLRGLVHMLQWDVEVCQGASQPLLGCQITAEYAHGDNGMSGHEFEGLAPLSERNAIEAYKEVLLQANQPVTIFAIGPLTNIANLISSYPNLLQKIEKLVIMGGGLKGGSVTMCAEFNFLADPEAAAIVFGSKIDITMVGIDVTEQAKFNESDVERLKSCEREMCRFLARIITPALERSYDDKFQMKYCLLHDVVAIVAATNPEIFSMKKHHVKIETQGIYTRGMSVSDQRTRVEPFEPNCTVVLGFDIDKFKAILFDVLMNK